MMDVCTGADRAAELRAGMVEALLGAGTITSARVQQALRTVPRHLFVPDGTSLEDAYNADESVPVKHSASGEVVSSTSAPFIQARMIEQAELDAGMSVVEIGSGGYNAALLAEVVGAGGRVVSIDIDPDITEVARVRLAAAGYADRVMVVTADAGRPLGDLVGRVDAVVVTAGAWDLPPAWWHILPVGGRLVVPLRMNGVTRSIAFHRQADHLVSASAEVCGFVAMQGEGAHELRTFLLPDPRGGRIALRFDGDTAPGEMHLLDAALATRRSHVWSGVVTPHGVSFADLHLWFASFLPGFCRVAADGETDLAAERGQWFPFGAVQGDSFAYLTVRPAGSDAAEFGAGAYGRHGQAAATAMVEQIQAWHRHTQHAGPPSFCYWPTGAPRPPAGPHTVVFDKVHGAVTISWPSAEAANGQAVPSP